MPLLGGHRGANDLAQHIGGRCARHQGRGDHDRRAMSGSAIALDDPPPEGYVLANPAACQPGSWPDLVAGHKREFAGRRVRTG
ncbi:MAG: hypothetical protein ACN6I5_00955 [Hyphomicrobiales bacterium]